MVRSEAMNYLKLCRGNEETKFDYVILRCSCTVLYIFSILLSYLFPYYQCNCTLFQTSCTFCSVLYLNAAVVCLNTYFLPYLIKVDCDVSILVEVKFDFNVCTVYDVLSVQVLLIDYGY